MNSSLRSELRSEKKAKRELERDFEKHVGNKDTVVARIQRYKRKKHGKENDGDANHADDDILGEYFEESQETTLEDIVDAQETVDHLGKQLAANKKQMDGFGSMLAFGVKNGMEGGKIVMNNIRLFTLAVSLGGVESLIEHPASMTHVSIPKQEREESGISDELIRVSLGCEHFEDLRDDLDQALNRIP